LDDWTNDMEDINISEYSHADPVVIGVKDSISGNAGNDCQLSGIVYLLHDMDSLFAGGIIFSGKKVNVVAAIELDGKLIEIRPDANSVKVDGKELDSARLAFGKQNAGDVVDSRLLNLTQLHKSGKTEFQDMHPGKTFELALSWKLLGYERRPLNMQAVFRIVGEEGAILQRPLPGPSGKNTMNLRITDNIR